MKYYKKHISSTLGVQKGVEQAIFFSKDFSQNWDLLKITQLSTAIFWRFLTRVN